jgi:hypothetical protein
MTMSVILLCVKKMSTVLPSNPFPKKGERLNYRPTTIAVPESLYKAAKQIIMTESPIQNAYPEEQEKLKSDFDERLLVTMLIGEILDEYGYHLGTKLVDGLPQVDLIKCDCSTE